MVQRSTGTSPRHQDLGEAQYLRRYMWYSPAALQKIAGTQRHWRGRPDPSHGSEARLAHVMQKRSRPQQMLSGSRFTRR